MPLLFTYHTKFDIDIANAIHSKRLQEASIKLLVENISACDEVWTVSHGAGENLRSLGYQGEYIVMPNGVDFPAGRLPEERVRAVGEGIDLPDGVPLLLFVGRMMWYKGLRIILDALKQLKDEGRDFRMVFVGKAPTATPSGPTPRSWRSATRCSFWRPAMTGRSSGRGIAGLTCSCSPPPLTPTALWCARRRPAALPAC